MKRETLTEVLDASRPLGPGGLIGEKYRLLRRLGEGAMGTVWLAHNELLDVDVAIKLMRFDSPRSNPTLMYQRLLQEAQAAARLGHPAIVRIFDFGRTSDGAPYIVMELLEGEPLSRLMDREARVEPRRAVQMILPIADALATAHGRGIVHRDVKPENIFLAHDDYARLQPKIVDFGVARFAEGGRTLTKSGALMGTPDYMAPEQAHGSPGIDHRVDVWALCVVLYELMAGDRPFGRQGANYLAVLHAIVEVAPRPLTDFGVGDTALWRILERGLMKDPAQRWDTMRVLGEALALWLYEGGVKEDAYGASLKTTWLQSGLDGVKIDTPSMSPPAETTSLPASERETLPEVHELSKPAPANTGRFGWLLISVATVAFLASVTALALVLHRPIEVDSSPAQAAPPPTAIPLTPATAIPPHALPDRANETNGKSDAGSKTDAGEASVKEADPAPLRQQRRPATRRDSTELPSPGSFDFGF